MNLSLLLFALSFVLAGCENKQISYRAEIETIKLAGKYADRKMEISGLEWYGDTLFFLDQIPSAHDNKIYFSSRKEIYRCLENNDVLNLHEFSFIQEGIAEKIAKAADYEAIAFKGDSVYLLVEAEEPMRSFIVQGLINNNALNIDAGTLTEIPLKHNINEIACEAMLIDDHRILVFYEANGSNIENSPQVFCFDFDLNKLEPFGFENIEYRITDATDVLKDNSFWVLNHFWPGEMELLKPAEERLIPSTYGSNKAGVSRLLHLQIETNTIKIKDNRPLMLPSGDWNWEGLAALDDSSFLIINDEFSAPPYRTEMRYIKMTRDE